jgi:hypothetical protein
MDRKRNIVRLLVYQPEIISTYTSFRPLGWIEIEHPAKYLGEEWLIEYEKRKDAFIETVLHKGTGNYIDDIAKEVMSTEEFALVIKDCQDRKKPKLPAKRDILQMVNMLHPELKNNNECESICDKIIFGVKMENLGLAKKNLIGNNELPKSEANQAPSQEAQSQVEIL